MGLLKAENTTSSGGDSATDSTSTSTGTGTSTSTSAKASGRGSGASGGLTQAAAERGEVGDVADEERFLIDLDAHRQQQLHVVGVVREPDGDVAPRAVLADGVDAGARRVAVLLVLLRAVGVAVPLLGLVAAQRRGLVDLLCAGPIRGGSVVHPD